MPKRSKGNGKKFYCSCGSLMERGSKVCISCCKKNRSIQTAITTKENLFSNRKGYQSARSTIRKHAALIYNNSNKPKYCTVCGYNKYYEICHIKSVASFNDIATLGQINHIDNLISLCPNCHWEYDNGLLIL